MDDLSDAMTATVIIHRIAKQIESHISEISRLLGLLLGDSSADEQVSDSDSFVINFHQVMMLSLTCILTDVQINTFRDKSFKLIDSCRNSSEYS